MRVAVLLLTALPTICACGSLVGVQGQPSAGDDGSNDPSPTAAPKANAPPASSSAAAPAPTSTPPPPAPTPAKLAFVTSASLAGTDPALASRANADALCNELATAAGFGSKTFAAWISDDYGSADDAGVLKAGVRYARPDGATIATDIVAAMKTQTPFENAIAVDEKLGVHAGSVWTFTFYDGSIGDTCSSDGSGSSFVSVGIGAYGRENDNAPSNGTPGVITTDVKTWTESGTPASCDQKKPIYCFEQ